VIKDRAAALPKSSVTILIFETIFNDFARDSAVKNGLFSQRFTDFSLSKFEEFF
jgi:hypothetical protein